MARVPTCDNCGDEIKEIGWLAQPARVELGYLVGTRPTEGEEQGLNTTIGETLYLCTKKACISADHPMKVKKADANGE